MNVFDRCTRRGFFTRLAGLGGLAAAIAAPLISRELPPLQGVGYAIWDPQAQFYRVYSSEWEEVCTAPGHWSWYEHDDHTYVPPITTSDNRWANFAPRLLAG